MPTVIADRIARNPENARSRVASSCSIARSGVNSSIATGDGVPAAWIAWAGLVTPVADRSPTCSASSWVGAASGPSTRTSVLSGLSPIVPDGIRSRS